MMNAGKKRAMEKFLFKARTVDLRPRRKSGGEEKVEL